MQRVAFESHLNGPMVACCGASVFRDVDLTASDIQVDLASAAIGSQTERVDAFLTDGDCTKLFDGIYSGTASTPLCKIYIGPIAQGTVSARQTLPRARYRVFAQAWTSNANPADYVFDLGIWGHSCAGYPTPPSARLRGSSVTRGC